MKILEITRSFYPSVGGMERFVSDKLMIYKALGLECTLITTDFSTEKRDAQLRALQPIRLRQFTPYNITPGLFFHLKKYDIVSVNYLGRFFSDYAIYHYSRRPAKIILTPAFSFHSNRLAVAKRFFQKNVFPALLKRIDSLVAFTDFEKHYWMDTYDVAEKKIHVIPPYVDARESDQERKTKSEPSVPYLLYLGRTSPNKKTDLLLNAFLGKWNLHYALYLTITAEDVQRKIREDVRADSRIKLLGYVTMQEKEELLRQCAGVICPTSWESFGYTAFEASRYAKPLVCSNIPVFREVLDGRGVLFFDNTEESMSNALLTFDQLVSKEKVERGEINHRNMKRFSFASCLQKYKTLLDSLSE